MISKNGLNNLKEVEQHIDGVLCGLSILKLPKEIALVAVLTVYQALQDHNWNEAKDWGNTIIEWASAQTSMLSEKQGVKQVIPLIMSKCRTMTPEEDRQHTISEETMKNVLDALQFCSRYETVAHGFWHYYEGGFKGSIKGRIIDFEYDENIDFGRNQLNFMLGRQRDYQSLKKAWIDAGRGLSVSAERLKKSLFENVRKHEINEVMHALPVDIYAPIREVAEIAQPRPTVDEQISCRGYTVGEYYRFWLEFTTIMIVYQRLIEAKAEVDKSFRLDSHRVFYYSLPDLLELLMRSGKIGVKKESAKAILSDLVLDGENRHPDVLVQPLVPLNERQGVVAPELVVTASWEVCLMRNWSKNPDSYGGLVASKKDKLADNIGSLFAKRGYLVSVRRKVTDATGHLVGDVDLAVFDAKSGLLVLFEVKWLIPPDSPRETISAHKEIDRGIQQAKTTRKAFETDRQGFLGQVFVGSSINVKETVSLVVGCGDVGSEDDKEGQVAVLDYSLLVDTIANSAGSLLEETIRGVRQKQAELSRAAAGMSGTGSIKLAGLLFKYPAFGNWNDRVKSELPKVGRNSGCLCGSGIKYKNCCLPIEVFHETSVEYA